MEGAMRPSWQERVKMAPRMRRLLAMVGHYLDCRRPFRTMFRATLTHHPQANVWCFADRLWGLSRLCFVSYRVVVVRLSRLDVKLVVKLGTPRHLDKRKRRARRRLQAAKSDMVAGGRRTEQFGKIE